MKPMLTDIASLFGVADVSEISELSGGHINRTFLVTAASGRFVLQSLSREAFPYPNIIEDNISAVCRAFDGFGGSVRVPQFIRSGGKIFIEADGERWRMYPYAESEPTYHSHEWLTGYAFGTFLRAAASADIKPKKAIDGFHDIDMYLKRLSEISPERAAMFGGLSARIADGFGGGVPLRCIHGDAKADNVITGRICTIIDLDTVMTGYAAVDFGDIVRSLCGGVPEREAVREIAAGYAEGTGGVLTECEVKSLYYGILWAVGELSVRYFIDGITREGYFRGRTPDECISRAEELYAQLCGLIGRERELCDAIHDGFADCKNFT